MGVSTLSVEDICNMAIGASGSRNFVTRLDDGSEEADVLNVYYHTARRKMLAFADWPFAKQRVALALTVLTRFGWAFVYESPEDALTIRKIWPQASTPALAVQSAPWNRTPRADQRIPYRIENDPPAPAGTGLGKIILCDQPTPECHYTADLEDTLLFPPSFADALSVLLGSRLANGLVSDSSKALELMNVYIKQALPDALAEAFGEEQEDQPPMSRYEAERIGGQTSDLSGFGWDT